MVEPERAFQIVAPGSDTLWHKLTPPTTNSHWCVTHVPLLLRNAIHLPYMDLVPSTPVAGWNK